SGGLLEEAIEVYAFLDQHEKVGDLQKRLGHEEQAAAAYRAAVAELRARRDTLGAARLLDKKLAAADEALELLWAEWPYGSQAALCVGEAFTLLGREGRHEDAARRITALLRQP